ncbi:MAG: DUF3106 domain-containing protein [Micavibrio sp.]|nr:DUF3106 domain-containing protein [Micavibrio sp.]
MKQFFSTVKPLMAVAAISAFCLISMPAHAQDAATDGGITAAPGDTDTGAAVADGAGSGKAAALKEKLQNMTPEQKEAMKAKMKAKMESLTPEQKAALREKMQERVKNMSPEQKQAFIEKMKARKAAGGGGGFRRRGGSGDAAGTGDSTTTTDGAQ